MREYEGKVGVMAGGTDLLLSVKLRLFIPEYILDLRKGLDLDRIENAFGKEVKHPKEVIKYGTIQSYWEAHAVDRCADQGHR